MNQIKRIIPAAFLLSALAACSTSDKPRTAETPAPPPAVPTDSAVPTQSTVPADSAEPTPGGWRVTTAGIGEIRAGMSLDEVKAIVGDALIIPAKLAECDYVRAQNAPKGVSFMIEKGKISRVDIQDNTTVKTVAGAGIGDTEDRIMSLYPEQVIVQPHKYTDGHYLVVTPPAARGTDMRIVFETDGRNVTRFRSGKLPAVEYVEGCS